jgi:IPT/TIG domain/Calx-beta domain
MPSRSALRAAFVALSLFLAMSSAAAECDEAPATYYHPRFTCNATSGVCPLTEPVIFTVFGHPYPPECATVRWSFADGTPDVWKMGYQPMAHIFAQAGEYVVTAWVQTPSYQLPQPQKTTVLVGNGLAYPQSGAFEEGKPASLTIQRTSIARGATDVEWAIVDGNGVPTTAITPASGTVTIPAGHFDARINVTVAGDAVYTGSRPVTLRTLSATNGYLVSKTGSTLTITDDDFAFVDFPYLITVREDVGTATVPLTRTGNMTGAVTIGYTASGTGVVTKTGTVTFAPGQTAASFDVQVVNDDRRTPDRNVSIALGTISAGVWLTVKRNAASALLRIEDDDPPDTLTVDDVAVIEGDAGPVSATLTLRLSRAQTYELQCGYSFSGTASRNRDYTTPGIGPIIFPPGVTEQTIEVLVHGDDLVEEHETVRLLVFPFPTGIVTAEGLASLVILNDDGRFGPELVRVEKGGSGNAVIDYLGKQSAPLVFAVASSNPSVASVPDTVTIEPGQAAAAFRIRGHALGAARITATPPPGYGPPMSIVAQVHDAATLVFEPGTVLLQPGDELTVRASLDPPSATEQKIRVKSVNPAVATASDWLIIPAGGQGSLVVRGVRDGGTSITATLPVELGEKTSLLNVTVETTGASLHSIVPSTGPAAGGTSFEAHGLFLTPDCTLRFGGVPATGVQFVSATLLTGTTPSHAAGATDVELQCGAASSVLRDGFTYLAAPPELTSISPDTGSVGGGTHVRVAATNVRSGCWLFLDGVPATGVETNGTTEMTALVPPRANTGTVAAAIRCGGATGMLANAFTYSNAAEPSASIMSIAPMAAAPGETVTVTGSRLRPSDRITFNDIPAIAIRTLPDAHLLRVPELPLGLATITVTGAGNRATTTGPIFMVIEPERPHIAAASPATTVAGAEVELTGRAFRAAYSFAVGGRPARTVSLEPQRVVLRLAANLEPGVHPIQLLNANGQVAVIGPSLTITSGKLIVRSVEAACGSTEGGVEAVIHGDGFLAGAIVTFNGVAATNTEVVDANTLRVTIPAGATGFARVVVTNPDGTAGTINDGFRYRSPFDPEGCVPASPRGRSVRH